MFFQNMNFMSQCISNVDVPLQKGHIGQSSVAIERVINSRQACLNNLQIS